VAFFLKGSCALHARRIGPDGRIVRVVGFWGALSPLAPTLSPEGGGGALERWLCPAKKVPRSFDRGRRKKELWGVFERQCEPLVPDFPVDATEGIAQRYAVPLSALSFATSRVFAPFD
jgi:hypothetical protein